jgi:hypothetical protein
MRCEATARTGERCKAAALAGGRKCSLHSNPDRARTMGKKGGAVRRVTHPAEVLLQLSPPTSAVDVRVLLGQSLAEVRAGRLSPTLAYAISSLSTAFLKAIDVGDYEARLVQLEQFREEFKRGRHSTQ